MQRAVPEGVFGTKLSGPEFVFEKCGRCAGGEEWGVRNGCEERGRCSGVAAGGEKRR